LPEAARSPADPTGTGLAAHVYCGTRSLSAAESPQSPGVNDPRAQVACASGVSARRRGISVLAAGASHSFPPVPLMGRTLGAGATSVRSCGVAPEGRLLPLPRSGAEPAPPPGASPTAAAVANFGASTAWDPSGHTSSGNGQEQAWLVPPQGSGVSVADKQSPYSRWTDHAALVLSIQGIIEGMPAVQSRGSELDSKLRSRSQSPPDQGVASPSRVVSTPSPAYVQVDAYFLRP
jgi:hypothetical protein